MYKDSILNDLSVLSDVIRFTLKDAAEVKAKTLRERNHPQKAVCSVVRS